MEFSNLFFIYLFLPLCIGIYFLAPGDKLKNGILICFSLLFYCLHRPIYVPLVFGMALQNYYLPRMIRNVRYGGILSVALNIGVLIVFKLWTTIPFPMGLSFYVFSLISYQVDVYQKGEECKNFWHFLLFVTFFPKMIMGPITRYAQIAPQMEHREVEPKAIFYGVLRFVLGLSKKILLADPLFRLYEQLGTHSSWLSVWGAGLVFMLYIYLEFSGYSDMALGLGEVFGFSLPENFRKPYTASSVGEFWRRWHISLGNFFRDYVYIPLGGNRKGISRQILHLFVVWLLTGLWHEISLTFVLWGMYFFVLLSAEKLLHRYICRIPAVIRRIFTSVFVYFGWIIFAAKDLGSFMKTIGDMFSITVTGLEPTLLVLRNSILLLSMGLVISVFYPVWKENYKGRLINPSLGFRKAAVVTLGLLMVVLLGLCTASIIGNGARPSMYAGF